MARVAPDRGWLSRAGGAKDRVDTRRAYSANHQPIHLCSQSSTSVATFDAATGKARRRAFTSATPATVMASPTKVSALAVHLPPADQHGDRRRQIDEAADLRGGALHGDIPRDTKRKWRSGSSFFGR